MTHLQFLFLFVAELNLVFGRIPIVPLFTASSVVELPCNDRRANKCMYIKCDLKSLPRAEKLMIPYSKNVNLIFIRTMQWAVKGQYLSDYKVNSNLILASNDYNLF